MILQLNHLDHIIDDYNRSITAEDLRSMLANNDYLKQRGIEIGYTKQGTDEMRIRIWYGVEAC